MSSSIFFRFKSEKEPTPITFDGTSLSVFEVKRDIIAVRKLGDGTDFDLHLYSTDGKEEYDDDTTQIPRSTTVIAQRKYAKTGAGRASRYVTGNMPVNAKNARRIESTAAPAANNNISSVHGAIGGGKELTEDEKLQALLSANDQTWRADQQSMSHRAPVRSAGYQNNRAAPVPDKPLPPGYICHRCGEKGHWIQQCPTNNDPTFDGRPKFKRTTGIPRSFLKVVEKPTDIGDDSGDNSQKPKGVMYTANGEWVIAEPDNATWEKIQEKQNAAAEKAKEVTADEQQIRDAGLECSIHNGIFVEPIKTPCCEATYCNTCIESALLDNDLKCPNCGTQPVLLDALKPDDEMTAKIKAYEDEKKAERTKKQAEAAVQSPAAAAGTPQGNAKSPPAKADGTTTSRSSTPVSRKRSADEELQNNRRPSNPAVAGQTNTSQAPSVAAKQPPVAPAADLQAFQQQMDAMSASMGPMTNGMPAMMNPMMPGFNPAMMGMPGMPGLPGMGMNMPMMGAGMPGMGMNIGMPPNFGNMGGMGGMNGWGGPAQMGNGNGNWQQVGMQQGGNGGGGGGNDSAYMRQPVNPNRHRWRQNRPRSTDYRQI